MKIRLLFAVSCLLFLSVFHAESQGSTNATNSTVRFRISYGATLLGDVDVELFDTDKPVTVSNFLAYAQSARYARSILHRLAPGFVLQGGGYTVPSPTAPVAFQVVNVIPEFPSITNEFAVGTLHSNVFGTLAMAKPNGSPNGATSQWFFNLGDNTRGIGATNLNTANGGYTVFGRVTAGTEVLQFLNGRSLNNGILNMMSTFYQAFCSGVFISPNGGLGYPFEALPVAFSGGQTCPTYADLLNIEIILLSARDVLPPKLVITSPGQNASVTDANVTLRGTVTDNTAIGSVKIYRGTNDVVDAVVTNSNWSAVLTNLPPGTNTVLVEAIDTSGLRAQVTRSFFRSVRAPVTLNVEGHGTISGASDQQLLEIGRGYRITARPDAGNLFAGWTGDVSGESATLNFLMASNLNVTAVFATNLFPTVRGTYNGLFHNPGLAEQASSGYFTLKLADSGAYSAKLLMDGRSYPMKGVFSPDGNETNLVARPGTNSLLLTLSLDLSGVTDQLSGTVTNNQATAIDTNAGWSATLIADRAVFHPSLNPAPQAGRYTVLIPADTNSPAGPPADGYGSVTVTTKGSLSFSGVLADGTRATQKSFISRDGNWPLYIPLAKGGGAVVSWVTFTNETNTDLAGLLNWFKQRQLTAKHYPNGFTNESVLVGSRFIPPTPTSGRVLDLTNAVVGFTNGNLAADFANSVILSADGKSISPDTNKLKLTISKSTGLFSGAVTPPGATRAVPFKGAILQKQNRGGGHFLGTNAAGSVTLGQ